MIIHNPSARGVFWLSCSNCWLCACLACTVHKIFKSYRIVIPQKGSYLSSVCPLPGTWAISLSCLLALHSLESKALATAAGCPRADRLGVGSWAPAQVLQVASQENIPKVISFKVQIIFSQSSVYLGNIPACYFLWRSSLSSSGWVIKHYADVKGLDRGGLREH